MHHFIIIFEFKLELESGNGYVRLWPLWPWPLTYDLDPLPGHHFCHLQWLLKISWWYDDRNIVKKVWQTGRRTDRRTERGVLRAAWSQLKMYPWLTFREIHWAHATLRGLNERSVRVSYVFCLYLSSSWNESWMCCGARISIWYLGGVYFRNQ